MFHRFDFEGAKCHWVWHTFVDDVTADLALRGYSAQRETVDVSKSENARYDVGGPVFLREDRDIYFEVPGAFPSRIVLLNKHAHYLKRALEEAPVRKGGYVKLHGRWCCLVISEYQAKILLADVIKWLEENE